jgi:hypothetical protein
MPLTADRNTPVREGDYYEFAPAAGQTIFRGAIVALNASSQLVRGAAATGLRCIGVAENSTLDQGYAGIGRIRAKRGVFRFRNSAAGEAITAADIGNQCFVADDDQVQRTNPGGNTRSACGIVRDVDAAGVWVQI